MAKFRSYRKKTIQASLDGWSQQRTVIRVAAADRAHCDPHRALEKMLMLPVTKEHSSNVEHYNESVKSSLRDQRVKDVLTNECFPLNNKEVVNLARTTLLKLGAAVVMTPEHLLFALDERIKMLDCMTTLISGLTLPRLYMVVSCFHFKKNFSFKQAFNKYKRFLQSYSSCDEFGKGLMQVSLEELIELQLLYYMSEPDTVAITPADQFKINFTEDELRRGIENNKNSNFILKNYLQFSE